MSMVVLFVAAAVVGAAVIVGFAARPWLESSAIRRDELSQVLARHHVRGVAALISGGVLVSCWLALDASHVGGLVGQLGLLQQLFLVGLALLWGGYLVVLPWQPLWVAQEFRRLAWILPALAATVGLAAAAMGIGSYLGALFATGLVALGASVPMYLAERVLIAAHPSPPGGRGQRM